MVRKSKRIQSIQSRADSGQFTKKPRAAPLSTITTSAASSFQTPTSPTDTVAALTVETEIIDDVRQRSNGGIPTTPEESDDAPTARTESQPSALGQPLGVHRAEELGSSSAGKRKRAEVEEQELLQRYLPADMDTTARRLGTNATQSTEYRAASLTRTVSAASSSNVQPSAPADHTFDLIQNAVSSVISQLSCKPSSESESSPTIDPANSTETIDDSSSNTEPIEVILSTAQDLVTQLETILFVACIERIQTLEHERIGIQEEMKKNEDEKEIMMKRFRELEEKMKKRGVKKTRFVPGC